MWWLFLYRVNLHITSCVNIGFHAKFWRFACEKLCGAMHGMYRMCEIVVELYHTYVCMYVHTYVCRYVCMYICTYVRMHLCMYVCMCVYVCVCILVMHRY